MSRFRVITEELSTASLLVSLSGEDIAECRVAVAGSGGALDGTPAAGAFEALLESAHAACSGFSQVATELSGALAAASHAYEMSDQSAAANLALRRG